MSLRDVLYVKERNNSDGEDEEGDEDIWDDRKLNDAYDKALKMANAEVAKRIAMATNSQSKIKSGSSPSKKAKESKSNTHNQKKNVNFLPDTPCRAIYEEDGQEYEATVLYPCNTNSTFVKFVGYNNVEAVPNRLLKPSLGEEARAKQMEEALALDEQSNSHMSRSSQAGSLTGNSEQGEEVTRDTDASSKGSKAPKKKKQPKNKKLYRPEMPFPIPDLSTLMSTGFEDMPLPPPPPVAFPCSSKDSEEQIMSSMLITWYMSGYYAGLYQGLKRSKENGKKK
ncbi:survival motor neuron protein isoform X1 [Amyelois transitella]|uniref:survival motor neuron protein isoform X1 n=1 Tax=Amyelois transitella TaxID=680683 RepID=UPI00298FFF36|nr:survival motor neuron protein isoform X1 [Amyelois transitella]